MLSTLLRPAFRTWYSRVFPSFDTIPTPVDEPSVTASGSGEDRILLLGSGPAAGWGVRSHDLALPGQLARELTAQTGHGTRVDVVTTRSMTVADAVPALDGRALGSYRMIVATLGISDAMPLLPEERWRTGIERLVAFLHSAAPDAQILLAGIPPIPSVREYANLVGRIANRHASRLNEITRVACLQGGHLSFAPLREPTLRGESRHRTPEEYGEWAQDLAAVAVPHLLCAAAAGGRSEADQDDPRDRALEQLESLSGEPAPGVDRVLSLARSLFSTEFGAVTLVGKDRVWFAHRSGEWPIESVARELSVCTHTIEGHDAFVVPDLATNDLFEGNEALARAGVRFYAGYPLETPDGHPLGALCVFDTDPRPEGDVDEALLRDVALLAQRELWKASREAAAESPEAVSSRRA